MEEAGGGGVEEYVDKSKLAGVCFVEWPENVEGLIKDVDFVIRIDKIEDNARKLTVTEGKDASCN